MFLENFDGCTSLVFKLFIYGYLLCTNMEEKNHTNQTKKKENPDPASDSLNVN